MTPPTLSGRITAWFFILLPLCVGAYFIERGLTDYPLPWETVHWSRAYGTITGRSVVLRGGGLARDSSGTRTWFDADVAYQYDVEGNVYAGENSFILDKRHREILHRSEAETRANERFPIGATVTVFYDPEDSSRSTLVTGWSSEAMPDLGTGVSCLVLAGYIGWLMRRKKTP